MKIRSNRAYLFFLSLLATAPPLSTDMYLPAIPDIARMWGVTESWVNLSLVLWFISYSVSLLIYGSLSDKYGRKPILLFGLVLFIVSSWFCASAGNVEQLILFRVFQGIGAASPSSMCMAICRDRFDGKQRQQILAYIGVILAVVPMLSPMIGSVLLKLVSWRWIFLTQSVVALISLTIALGYDETAKNLISTPTWLIFSRYFRLVHNRDYLLSCMAMGIIVGPYFGYIAFSPIVYMSIFQESKEVFSLLFGLNALATMIGSYVCAKLIHRFSTPFMLTVGFSGCFLGGAGLLTMGHWSAYSFFAGISTFSFFSGMTRPVSNHLILDQVREDIGSASSFLVFYQMMVGSSCMWISTLPWDDPILAYGVLAALLPATVLGIWPVLLKSLRKKGRLPV